MKTTISIDQVPSGIPASVLGNGTLNTTKLHYLDNVTSDLQAQIDALGGGPGGGDGNLASYTGVVGLLTYIHPTGAYTTRAVIAGSNKLLVTNPSGIAGNISIDLDTSKIGIDSLSGLLNATGIANGTVTNTEFEMLTGLAGNVQTQIDDINNVIADGSKVDIVVDGPSNQWIVNTGVVSYAKMQNTSAASIILGRGSASGAGTLHELTLNSTLSLSNNVLGVGTLTSGNIPTQIDAVKIGDASVDNTTFGYLSGATSNIQTQLTDKTNSNDFRIVNSHGFQERVLSSRYDFGGTATLAATKNQAIFVFLSQLNSNKTIQYIEGILTANAAGTGATEVGLYSSTSPPNKSGLILTRLVATGIFTSVTAGAAKVVRNTNPLNYTVNSGTYLWIGIKHSYATTQPTFRALSSPDMGHGYVQASAGTGPDLVSANGANITGVIVTSTSTTPGPALRATLD